MTDQDLFTEQPPVVIPKESLSPEALRGVIDNFILREGTDYGTHEVEHETKVQQVQKQLERKHIKIVYDPNTQSVTLMTEKEWAHLQAKYQE